MSYYILGGDDGRTPIPASYEEAAAWREKNPDARRVDLTLLSATVQVSTVFLAFSQAGYPLLFETLVFGGRLGGHLEYYSTWDEAAAGHARWVQTVRVAEGETE